MVSSQNEEDRHTSGSAETESEDEYGEDAVLVPSEARLDKWHDLLVRYCHPQLFKFMQFISSDTDLEKGSLCQELCCRELGVNRQNALYFWEKVGQGTVRNECHKFRQVRSTNFQRRFQGKWRSAEGRGDNLHCVAENHPGVCNVELVRRGISPPDPREILAGVGISATSDLVALRKNRSIYYKFLRYFLACAVGAREWKVHGESSRISSYVDSTMEAFALILYENGYDVWKSKFLQGVALGEDGGSEEDAVSAITDDSSATFRYTGKGRGARRYGGWSDEGINRYNMLVEVIDSQRADGETGVRFEEGFLEYLLKGNESERRKRKRAVGVQGPKACNRLKTLYDQQRRRDL